MRITLALYLFTLSAMGAVTSDYYFGEIRITSPNGRPKNVSLALAKRVMDPAKHVIVEEIFHVDPSTTQKYTNILKVTGDRLSAKDSAGRYSGQGKLHGKPWAWTKWEVDATLTDGSGTFKSKFHRTKDGIFVMRDFFDAKGKIRLRYSEDLRTISREIYELLQSRLAKPSDIKKPVG